MNEMVELFREIFEDDYIVIKNFLIEPFSFLWFVIRLGQCALGVVGVWAFYMAFWLLLG